MSLLAEIRDSCANSSVKLGDLLRKCLVLAARLDQEEFRQWAEHELNGYDGGARLPDYRVLKAIPKGNFLGFDGTQFRSAQIPSLALPEGIQETVGVVHLRDPISSLEELARSKEDVLEVPWPADLVALVGRRMFRNMNCLGAWEEIPRGAIVAVVEAVRNRTLKLTLEVESELGEEAGGMADFRSVEPDRVGQMVQNIIYGNVGNIAAHSKDVRQEATLLVRVNDLESLKEYLSGLGVGSSDLEELESALEEDSGDSLRRGIGKQTSEWLGKMIAKASSGALKIGVNVASNLLTNAILQYLGRSS